jgi:hypothetical protein
MKKLTALACLAVLALTVAGAAAAATTRIQGTAMGKTTLESPGVYHMVGSFSDPTTGIAGKYEGHLYNSGDYTHCAGDTQSGCHFDPLTGQAFGTCNIVTGDIRFHWGPHSISLLFGNLLSFFRPSVCLQVPDTGNHDVALPLFNLSPPAFPTKKLGPVDFANGFMTGVSVPANDSKWSDTFSSFYIEYGTFEPTS